MQYKDKPVLEDKMVFPQTCYKKYKLVLLDGSNVSYRMSQACLCAQISVQKVRLVDKLWQCLFVWKTKLCPLLPTTVIRYLYFMCLKYKIELFKIFHSSGPKKFK